MEKWRIDDSRESISNIDTFFFFFLILFTSREKLLIETDIQIDKLVETVRTTVAIGFFYS